jgi:hypothetical protein
MAKVRPHKKRKKDRTRQQDGAVVAAEPGHPATDTHSILALQRTVGNRAVTDLLQAGHPLDADVRGKMEAAFGQDFSQVHIHNDAEAARLSDTVNARAFTVGQDVAFATGEYQPGTSPGDALIAHELAHVVQQSHANIRSDGHQADSTYDALEDDAERAAKETAVTTRGGRAGHDAGSTAAPRMRSGLQLQRADPAPAAPAPAAPSPDVSALPEGVVRDAVTELSQSTAEIERNTAQQLVEGNLHAYYIEDLKTPAGADAKLQSMGADPAVYTILLHPVTGEEIYAQKNFRGFAMGTDIFGMKSDPVAEWKVTLVHETSHAANPADRTSQLESYKTEFRAYWVADYANVADLDVRAAQVKARVLQDYAAINDAYKSDPAVKTAIDFYTRPEGDVLNVTGLKQTTPATP